MAKTKTNRKIYFDIQLSDRVKSFILGLLITFSAQQTNEGALPLMLEPIAIMLISLNFSRKIAIPSVILFLIFGLLQHGTHFFNSQNVGFLVGLIPFALTISLWKEKLVKVCSKNFCANIVICFAAYLVLFICGILSLTFSVGFEKAIEIALTPFIFTILLKVIIACSLSEIVWQRKCVINQ